jgi:hypothetical protein
MFIAADSVVEVNNLQSAQSMRNIYGGKLCFGVHESFHIHLCRLSGLQCHLFMSQYNIVQGIQLWRKPVDRLLTTVTETDEKLTDLYSPRLRWAEHLANRIRNDKFHYGL